MTEIFSDKLPLSYQLSQLIRQQIINGTYTTGSKIPPEVKLAKKYNVSVITVQRALRSLEDEKLICRQRGKGTFVSDLPSHLARPTSHLALDMMFSDEFLESEILERRSVPVPAHLEAHFPDIERLGMYRRLVYQEGEPWSYTVHHVLEEYLEEFSEGELKRFPMFRLLRDKLNLALEHVAFRLQAQTPSPEVAGLLRCQSLDPILIVNARLYDTHDRIIDIPQIHFRGDRFTFSFDMDLRGNNN